VAGVVLVGLLIDGDVGLLSATEVLAPLILLIKLLKKLCFLGLSSAETFSANFFESATLLNDLERGLEVARSPVFRSSSSLMVF